MKENREAPFFTIAITTYNRHDLLRETLASVLSQSFTDFEVIVGNDYTQEVLTAEILGIDDPRLRIVNHQRNLREVGNMNALLRAAAGRYFTWLFDDDLFEPDFLRTAYEILTREAFPSVLFPRHRILRGGAPYRPVVNPPGTVRRLDGRSFLRGYFSGDLKIISTSGLFATALFRAQVGGVEELCDSAVGLYCEYLLLVKCARLQQILYVDTPFVVFRAHAESWGDSNAELHKYFQGGERLVRRSAEVLREVALRDDFPRYLLGVGQIHLSTFSFVAMRAEAAAKRFDPSAIGRALGTVRAEAARIWQAMAVAGVGGFGSRLRFIRILAKCGYLVVFSFFYYGRRRWLKPMSQA